ncbi:MAG: hypothetical protein IJ944_04660 [Clostridia bacterium]|nr:hypothetical protein [Clostridia bacterium]
MNGIFIYTVVGVVLVSILGCLSHFAYEWLGNNPIFAFLFATNESIFQHMKIFIMPYFAYSIFEYFAYGKNYQNFISAKGMSLLAGTLFIPVFFYSYSGILGFNIVWLDISIYFMAVILAFYVSYKKMNQTSLSTKTDNSVWFIVSIIIVILTIIFSYYSPDIALFIPEQ